MEQRDFDKAKRMLEKEATIHYPGFPDFSKAFEIHADASDEQLGAVLSQGGHSLAYYTQKLNSAQHNYTVGGKELLGLVEALKAFDSTIWGQKIILYTNHLNLLY